MRIMSFGEQKSEAQLENERLEKWRQVPVADRIAHIHIPKTGGTWLNHRLHEHNIAVYDHGTVEYCGDNASHEPLWRMMDEMDQLRSRAIETTERLLETEMAV